MNWDEESEEDWYDVMQVCENGHVITAYAQSQPQSTEKYCAKCGVKTVDACLSCNENIRGYRHITSVLSGPPKKPPNYCINCGQPFPWQSAAIENLKEILNESDLGADDLKTVDNVLFDVVRDTPKTESASLKLMGVFRKLKKPVYNIVIGAISDIASETAKKTMGID